MCRTYWPWFKIASVFFSFLHTLSSITSNSWTHTLSPQTWWMFQHLLLFFSAIENLCISYLVMILIRGVSFEKSQQNALRNHWRILSLNFMFSIFFFGRNYIGKKCEKDEIIFFLKKRKKTHFNFVGNAVVFWDENHCAISSNYKYLCEFYFELIYNQLPLNE